jgi:hypothetical protein
MGKKDNDAKAKESKIDKEPPVQWDDIKRECLLRALIKYNKDCDGGVKSSAWKKVVKAMNDEFPTVQWKKSHVQSQRQNLKKRYLIFKKLKDNDGTSGWGWDERDKMATAPPAVWDSYLLQHKDAKEFRYKGFILYDLCFDCFGSSTADGRYATSAMDSSESSGSSDEDSSLSATSLNSDCDSDLGNVAAINRRKRTRRERSTPAAHSASSEASSASSEALNFSSPAATNGSGTPSSGSRSDRESRKSFLVGASNFFNSFGRPPIPPPFVPPPLPVAAPLSIRRQVYVALDSDAFQLTLAAKVKCKAYFLASTEDCCEMFISMSVEEQKLFLDAYVNRNDSRIVD